MHRPLKFLSVGDGPVIVLLHGFAMQPRTYLPTARLLASRTRIVVPNLFDLGERWSFEEALDGLEATLEEVTTDPVTLLGHSFGGGLELGLAAREPARIRECVFSDTLGVHREFGLALEAVHPLRIVRMATPLALSSFFATCASHPMQLAEAGWWAFRSNRRADIDAIRAARIPCHVLWAARDSILSRKDGMEFARLLDATFTVAEPTAETGPVDHDWMFDDPELFVAHLERLELRALS